MQVLLGLQKILPGGQIHCETLLHELELVLRRLLLLPSSIEEKFCLVAGFDLNEGRAEFHHAPGSSPRLSGPGIHRGR